MKNSTGTTSIVTLKAIEKELNAILEEDIRKFTAAQYIKIKYAAFLQLIAA